MEIKQEKKKSIKKNYFYNLFYQVFILIVPILVTPYVSRILSSDGVGQYSFSFSIVTYFSLLASLGFGFYAQREISQCRDDKERQAQLFWEICIIRLISSLLSSCGLIVLAYIPFFYDYKTLLIILSINVISVAIDSSFIFQGNEDFKQITICNFLAKLISIVFIFLFVKTKTDLWKYALIQSLSPLFSCLFMIPFLKKYLISVQINTLHPFKHFIPSLKLFVPTIAISVYTILDKTMIGFLIPGETTVIQNGLEVIEKVSDIENGNYSQAEKIIKLLTTVVTSLGTVMIPRNSYFFEKGDTEQIKNNVFKGLRFAFLLALPLMLGVVSVANNFSSWFFGDGYEKVPLLMMVFSPLILAIGLNNVFGIQYLIPTGKDKAYTLSVLVGAIVNLILNSFLIKNYWSVGAAIASVCAEFSVLIFQLVYLRKDFPIKKVFLSSWKYALSAIVMFIPCYFLGKYLLSSVLNTIIIVIVGVFTYGVMLFIVRDEFIDSMFKKVIGKFKREK